ncbi:biopolymer transporter ExbD [Ectothiorhodospiraceae bacterium WFHF3C12]|nr:biopolymer transporter ExbD [Ectothiorhodospiraceae bacterium WFHF3C12]
MRIEETRRRPRSPSLTPLIDVVFILLVFFMLVSSFVEWRAIKVDTPPAVTLARPGADTTTRRLQVFPGGRLVLDGETVDLPGLARRVRARPGEAVQVVPMPGLTLQPLVTVLDRIAAAGGSAALREP